MSSPNFADYLVGGAGGAAMGFLENQAKEHEAEKLKKEQARQVELLYLKETLAAKREERKAGIEHGYKMDELGAKQKFDAEEGQRNRAAKVIDDANKDELERWKTAENNSRALEVAKIGAEARKVGRSGVGDEKEIRRSQMSLRKAYSAAMKNWELDNPDKDAPDFDSWAQENYPEAYDFAFSGDTAGAGSVPMAPGAQTGGEIKPSKIDAIFESVGASRVKQGANAGKEIPAAKGQPGDIIEPQPISVDKAGAVRSPAPAATDAAELPDMPPLAAKGDGARAAELKAQAASQRGKLVSTAGLDEVFSAASDIAKGFVAGTKNGAKIVADLYMAFLGKPTEDIVQWGIASQNQQAAMFLIEQRLKNGVITEKEYNAEVAKLRG